MQTKLIVATALALSPILIGCTTSKTAQTAKVGVQTIPEQYRGEWNQNLADCGTDKNDSRLRIEADRIHFWESEGTVSNLVENGPNEVRMTAHLSGEGETSTRELRMELAGGPDTLLIDDSPRYRCK